ncbi:MAG: pentapeptide repeat-containing protein [Clostridiales bacterium]|nr:pentapeptide repeat-containing protein [Clostridiales bacterium]
MTTATTSKKANDRINYSNRKKINADFSNKDLKRSNCFSSDFSGSNFSHASFKGAQFKHCNFFECDFVSSEFIATNLRNSKFVNAKFKDVIFDSANLEGVNFENASFDNVVFANTDTSQAINFDASATGIRLFEALPELNISERLERSVKASKKNEFIKSAGVLDTKTGTINPISIMILLENFSEEVLITAFSRLKKDVDTNFATLSYLIEEIKAYQIDGLR